MTELQRLADIKTKEYTTLKETLKTIKSVKNDKEAIQSFLDVSEIKAELAQMKSENLKYSEQLSQGEVSLIHLVVLSFIEFIFFINVFNCREGKQCSVHITGSKITARSHRTERKVRKSRQRKSGNKYKIAGSQ